MKGLRTLIVAFTLWFFAGSAVAHEVRPALLSLDGTPDGYAVTWKQPVNNGRRLKLTPVFPDGCEATLPATTLDGETVVERFTLNCALDAGEIRIDGLARTLTDVFIRIHAADGSTRSALVKPSKPVMDLTVETSPPANAYFGEGILHIVMGWDHLLFVLGLCLLVTRKQVLGVATSFTLAHSLTLVVSALGLFSLPSRPVEILIAASILLLAVEIIRKWRGEDGLTAQRPYLVSFGIGLIHGLGFAGALADLGLPKGQELLALVLFNLGVEAGQFAIIAAALGVGYLGYRLAPKLTRPTATLATYAIGSIAAYWVIERLAGYVV
ncbi:MAG: HupE/UreJ family protein [Litorimonas sp.]